MTTTTSTPHNQLVRDIAHRYDLTARGAASLIAAELFYVSCALAAERRSGKLHEAHYAATRAGINAGRYSDDFVRRIDNNIPRAIERCEQRGDAALSAANRTAQKIAAEGIAHGIDVEVIAQTAHLPVEAMGSAIRRGARRARQMERANSLRAVNVFAARRSIIADLWPVLASAASEALGKGMRISHVTERTGIDRDTAERLATETSTQAPARSA